MERSPLDFERLGVRRDAQQDVLLKSIIPVIVLAPVSVLDRTCSFSSSCHVLVLRTPCSNREAPLSLRSSALRYFGVALVPGDPASDGERFARQVSHGARACHVRRFRCSRRSNLCDTHVDVVLDAHPAERREQRKRRA
jgi:hypothetical protein